MNKIKFSLFSLALHLGLTGLALADGVSAVPAGVPATPMGGAAAQGPGGIMAFAPFILMFAVMYFLILRPQQKKMKDQQSMISSLKQGDKIVTNSGIFGKITDIQDKVVTVEIAERVRVEMLKSQVSQVVKGSVKDLAP